MKNKYMQNQIIIRISWFIVLIVLWQIIARSQIFDPLIFPPLGIILNTFYISILDGKLIYETFYSLFLIIKGLLMGIIIAMVIASLSAWFGIVRGLVETITAIVHPLPGIALLPLIILWMGTGTKAILFIIVHSVLWPMILNIFAGFGSIPQIYREVGKNIGLNGMQKIRYILIPASLPYLLSGIKIGWARAWRALISAEMLFGAVGGKGGLGWYIFQRRVFMDTAGIYAGLIVIIIIGVLVEDLAMKKIEDITTKRWGMTI